MNNKKGRLLIWGFALALTFSSVISTIGYKDTPLIRFLVLLPFAFLVKHFTGSELLMVIAGLSQYLLFAAIFIYLMRRPLLAVFVVLMVYGLLEFVAVQKLNEYLSD